MDNYGTQQHAQLDGDEAKPGPSHGEGWAANKVRQSYLSHPWFPLINLADVRKRYLS